MKAPKTQNYINHIALVLDASSSIEQRGLTKAIIKVADDQVAYLARRSQELGQETRISVYTFADLTSCLIWDMDALRLPSIADLYQPYGNTALIDATLKSQEDLARIWEGYGDHAFLTYILTDGEENRSKNHPSALTRMLASQPSHWTIAVLVPNMTGKHEAKKLGFPAENIAVWDATTAHGVAEAGSVIRRATDAYMTARTSGVRGTRTLFSTGADAVNSQTVAAAGLTPLPMSAFRIVPVPAEAYIREFVEGCGLRYELGKAFYELTKPETIQPRKDVAIVEKRTDKVYVGREAREIVGLPDMEVRVKPDRNPDYTIFIQSTSVNRKLMPGTKLLVLS